MEVIHGRHLQSFAYRHVSHGSRIQCVTLRSRSLLLVSHGYRSAPFTAAIPVHFFPSRFQSHTSQTRSIQYKEPQKYEVTRLELLFQKTIPLEEDISYTMPPNRLLICSSQKNLGALNCREIPTCKAENILSCRQHSAYLLDLIRGHSLAYLVPTYSSTSFSLLPFPPLFLTLYCQQEL